MPNLDDLTPAQVALAVVEATREVRPGLARIPVFSDETGVRVRCFSATDDVVMNREGVHVRFHYGTAKDQIHAPCHGLGYTATQDLAVLAKAAWDNVIGDLSDSRLPDAALRRSYLYACGRGNTQAVYRIVTEALVALGYELGPTGVSA